MENHKDRLLLIVTGGIVLLGIIGLFWWRAMNTIPAIKIPNPKMPSPNARDYFIAACNAMRDSNKVGFAIDDSKRPTGTPRSGSPYDRAYSLAEKEQIVRHNAHALATLRKGFAYRYWEAPARSFEVLYTHYPMFREMARLLVLEGNTKAAHGDWGGAADSYLDAMRFAADAPHGGTLISKLVGIAVQSVGRHPAWKALDHLSAGQARRAARRMEDIIAREFALADMLQEEKWLGLAGTLEVFRKTGVSGFVGTVAGGSGSTAGNLFDKLRSLRYSKRTIILNYSRYMDRMIANARLPYAAAPPAPPVPDDPVNDAICPVFDRMQFSDARGSAQNVLLLVSLALRAYWLERGEYPASLADLAPSYLRKLPDDPFALKGTLRYKRTGRTYVLYSLGPDCRDDGGKRIDSRANARYGRQFSVEYDSKGDIVAGINQ